MTKQCTKCEQAKPTSEFNKRSSSRDGLSSQCSQCNRDNLKAHYGRNKDYYITKGRELARKKRKWLAEQKDVPCADCGGEFPPYCMDFDHSDPAEKVGNVSRLVKDGSWQALRDEIAKCEIVCANCHRIRTHAHSGVV